MLDDLDEAGSDALAGVTLSGEVTVKFDPAEEFPTAVVQVHPDVVAQVVGFQ